jgi:nucleoside-diphosphate-sugar epimerase
VSKDRAVLITGGTGFIGAHLAAQVVKDGCSVHLIVRPDSNLQQVSGLIDGAHLHVHDGTTQGLIDIVRNVQPQSVFHLASLFIAEHLSCDVERLVSSNILFGSQLLEAMKVADVRRLVNAGTSWQHFHSDHERATCLYAATKRAFQDIVEFYSDAYGLRAITLKLFDTYGPGDVRRKLFRLLKDAARTGEPLSMSAGEQQIDLVYIDDVVEAFRNAEERLISGAVTGHEIFGVSSGKPMPLREVVEHFKKAFDRELKIDWGARPYRSREVMVNWNGLPGLPGWSPKIILPEGLRRMRDADGAVSQKQ